jgi:hypothetical protein
VTRGPGKVALGAAFLGMLCVIPSAAVEPTLFVYFKEPANMGIFFAVSHDGYRWTPLKHGEPWLGIQHTGELMRDPFLTRGPDKEFHLVWTWGWRGTSLGYAHSPDLVHWSEQREVVMMPGAENTWAPEIYWDGAKSQWMIVWSSRVPGHVGNRIYRAWTADFKTVGKPELFWDPGYPVIDATILEARGRYYMVFKDETVLPVHRWLKIAEADSLEGPYRSAGEAFTESWSEGPSAMQVGSDYIVYYDHYRDPKRYEAVRSQDLQHWTPIPDQVQFPEGCKHGSFLKISEEELARLSEVR